jgi:Ion channel
VWHLDSGVIVSERSPKDGDRRERYGAALVAITIAFAIQGVATPSKWEEVLVSALLGLVLLLVLWEARVKRRLMVPAIVIVAGSILASIAVAASGNIDDAATRLPDALVVAVALPAIVVGAARNLRRGRQVTLQTVLAVLSVYMLVGMLFANVYVSINDFGGGPFFAAGQPANVANCMYYSFTTLTTVGYGDFTARTNLGHTLSGLEGVIGPLYLVTVVALIVTNIGRRRPLKGGADTPRELPSLRHSTSPVDLSS